jgi:exonuclease III
LCETKTGEGDGWKIDSYEGIVSSYKRGQEGLIVAARKGTFVSMEKVSELSNILSVQIVYPAVTVRVIVCHGPQEYGKNKKKNEEDIRKEFFENLAVEIERGKSSDEIPIVMGDLNAKMSPKEHELGHQSEREDRSVFKDKLDNTETQEETSYQSGNGKLMSELLDITQNLYSRGLLLKPQHTISKLKPLFALFLGHLST